jgi:hypothetical protein
LMRDEICTNIAKANKKVIIHNLNRQRNNARAVVGKLIDPETATAKGKK